MLLILKRKRVLDPGKNAFHLLPQASDMASATHRSLPRPFVVLGSAAVGFLLAFGVAV
jgi:hypothetical protein